MALIRRIEIRLVDIPPKVKRTLTRSRASSRRRRRSFRSPTPTARSGPIFSIRCGTGRSSMMRPRRRLHLAPRLIGKDAERTEAIWRELEYATHATTIGAISALAPAAIDTALWDLRARCKRRGLLMDQVAESALRPWRAPLHHRGRLAASRGSGAGRGSPMAAREQGFMEARRSKSAGRMFPRTTAGSRQCARPWGRLRRS